MSFLGMTKPAIKAEALIRGLSTKEAEEITTLAFIKIHEATPEQMARYHELDMKMMKGNKS